MINKELKITADQNGIAVNYISNVSEAILIAWNSISRVGVFKSDVFAHDLICMIFEMNDGKTLEINEDMKGDETHRRAWAVLAWCPGKN